MALVWHLLAFYHIQWRSFGSIAAGVVYTSLLKYIAAVLGEFDASVYRFCSDISSNQADGMLDEGANGVKNGIHAEILKIQLSGGPTHFKDPVVTPAMQRDYKQATAPYIITLMDKNGANFVIICKKKTESFN